MIRRVHHIGIVVADLGAAIERYERLFGLRATRPPSPPGSQLAFGLIVLPGTELELIAERSAGSPIGKFLAERGPGMHHLAFEVTDISRAIRAVAPHGLAPLAPPSPGIHGTATCFFHPRETGGVLIEYVERGHEVVE